ncbi:hypothetical protein EW146_g9796, partial [Bondarzewia mesenterica]
MPFIDLLCPIVGEMVMHYTISTPTNPSATTVDTNIPTILFLHPVYIAQQIFHPQFLDPILRRFNLIALDSRCHGASTGAVHKNFSRKEAADDIYQLLKVLDLPACHVVGLSMGACIGLSLAIDHPEKVLSLCMMSPLPLEEPEDVAGGREEIYRYWFEAFADPEQIDESELTDAVYGAVQLGFNNAKSGIID